VAEREYVAKASNRWQFFLLLVQEALSQKEEVMGRRLIEFSKVLGKPINEADIRGAGVAYSMWEE